MSGRRAAAKAPRHRAERIELAPGTSRIVVVADTHSKPHPKAATAIEALGPAAILHAGDIGEGAVLDDLATLAPVIAVRGNIDERRLPDSIALTLSHPASGTLRILLMHIAVRGPRLRADARRLAGRHGAQLVVCGHSHVPLIAAEHGITVFNPGSIGPRRFQLPITFGVIEIGERGLSLRHLDCETGERWSPGP